MFKDMLKNLRKEHHISQKQLSEILFVSQQAIAKWETDKATPNPDMLSKIADYFDVSVDYLLGNTEERKSDSSFLSLDEDKLLENFRELNEQGQAKVLEYVEDLVYSCRYKKHNYSKCLEK